MPGFQVYGIKKMNVDAVILMIIMKISMIIFLNRIDGFDDDIGKYDDNSGKTVCGNVGKKCANETSEKPTQTKPDQGCSWSNAVFKVVPATGVKSCDDYFLFNKILDKDGKKGEKEKDKRITLGDMCPKECHKNVCKQ